MITLLVLDTGHESCDVPLCVKLESLHCRTKLRSGCYVDVIMILKVQEFGALECVVFIPYGSGFTEPTGPQFTGGLGVATQFNIQAVVGASETECLGSEVGRPWLG